MTQTTGQGSPAILLIGGSGIVGRWTARFLRAAHPGFCALPTPVYRS